MKIIEKIAKRNLDSRSTRPACIAFLGDSMTQGCFEIYAVSDSSLETVYEEKYSYGEYLKERLYELFPRSSIVCVNAGISGDTAKGGLARLERDVLSFSPDLTIVCFGLNDCGGGDAALDAYAADLKKIISALKNAGGEVILMTPNTAADHLSVRVANEAAPFVKNCTEDIVRLVGDGVLDRYAAAARKVAADLNVPVCDLYARWKKMNGYGVDTTELLANRANHPSRSMNKLTADMLLEVMLNN